jgi:hypothetical protein
MCGFYIIAGPATLLVRSATMLKGLLATVFAIACAAGFAILATAS